MTEMTWLFVLLFIVLAIASTISLILMARYKQRHEGMLSSGLINLNARINAWWVMVLVIGIAFAFGKKGVIILFLLASLAAFREFLTIVYTARSDHRLLVGVFLIVIPLQYFLLWYEWYGVFTIFIPVYCFLAAAAWMAIKGDTKRYLERVSELQWGLMLSTYCLSYVPALATLLIIDNDKNPLLLIAFLLITVQGSDVLQYVFGKLFGNKAIAPHVSPSKTWAGFIGGVATTSILGAALFWLTPFSPLIAALMACLCALMGFLGGLVASAIKRDKGVKDWGNIIHGHGGMMDRADSLVFAAPIFFHLTRYFYA